MWTDEYDEYTISEGNVLDIASVDSIRHQNEVVRVHCLVCGEGYTGTKDGAGLFLLGHRHFHLWEVELHDVLGGP